MTQASRNIFVATPSPPAAGGTTFPRVELVDACACAVGTSNVPVGPGRTKSASTVKHGGAEFGDIAKSKRVVSRLG